MIGVESWGLGSRVVGVESWGLGFNSDLGFRSLGSIGFNVGLGFRSLGFRVSFGFMFQEFRLYGLISV